MMAQAPLRMFLIAGEPSGDKLGAALMSGLKLLVGNVECHGIGGPLMQAEGLVPIFPMDELSVMGLAEILPRLRGLLARLSQTTQAVLDLRPDALITIDIPEFSLRVARRVKARAPGLRTIHYVAPTVWAWRPGRAKTMAGSIDHVLALFPFEPPLMQAAGMSCDFVGHPIVAEPVASPAEAAAFRADHGVPADAPLMLVLPGSRRSEVARLAPRFGQAMTPVLARHPDARLVVPTVAATHALVHQEAALWTVPPIILPPDAVASKRAAFAAADVALAASGTVSLELAAAATPMVVAYDMNWLSYRLIRALAVVDTVTLVNLVSDTRVVPEFLGPACRPGPIGDALLALLDDPTSRAAQLAAAEVTMDRLGRGGEAPGLRAARSVLARLKP